MKTYYSLKTMDRQGEYLKPEYDNRPTETGYTHYTWTNKKRVENWANENNINGWIYKWRG